MARYKATVIFDVHEDDEKKEEGLVANLTEYVKDLSDLLAEHMVKSFYDDIKERTGNKEEKFKTTYKIVSFEKLQNEDNHGG
jgi:LPS O-antigen subunit length determinant protein (WzzB/FepE family)